jgi:prevent-host-death family protein
MVGLSISEARDTLAEIVNRVAYQGERVVLHRHGKPVAVLVPAADLERLSALETQKPPRRIRRRGA